MACCVLCAPAALAVELHSIHILREDNKILVRGADLDLVSSVLLGGSPVPIIPVSPFEFEIPFGTEVYGAIAWEGSYNLVVDDALRLSVYIDGPITAPPPPPPTGGPDCPCITGWASSAIPQDNFTWCLYGQDGDQLWMYGVRDQWTISTAFEPGNIVFDPVSPGNSISYCVLLENGSYTVAEPVVNIDQYSDCELWLWRKICI
jgi:hypothetical protein